MWNQKYKPKTDILLIQSPTSLFLHNCPSHSDAYIWLISTWSWYLAIHLLPTLNTDCPSQCNPQTSDWPMNMSRKMCLGWSLMKCLGRCTSYGLGLSVSEDVPHMILDEVEDSEDVLQKMSLRRCD